MLQISNLSFSFRERQLFKNLNATFSNSEIVAIIGDNGSGKTTLLRLIAGELRPDEGSIKTTNTVGFMKQVQEDFLDKSGGERTQIRLAELFRQKPGILLLDEPTNNLDHESKAWLAKNLRTYRGLVLVVSHDRTFLENVADKIIQLHDGQADVFSDNYVNFCKRQEQEHHDKIRIYEQAQDRKRKLELQLKSAHDQVHKSNRRSYDKIKDESKLHHNRQRTAAQDSAGKFLRKAKSQIKQISAIEKPLERKTYKAEVSANFSHNRKLLEVKNLAKHYGRKKLFEGLNFEIYTGERIRVVGRNGSGKSTLFRIILGEVKPDHGEVRIAPNISIGYISQDSFAFDPNKNFFEQNREFDQTEVFRAAATMDFTPQDMKRPVGELSRGQMTKLSILKLILRPLDLVIIDELTNHIDVRARENIENALKNYRGAILLATHDDVFAKEMAPSQNMSLRE